MPPSNRKAVARHRDRQKRKGLVRVEIQVPTEDMARVRALAEALRNPDKAAAVRAELERVLGPPVTSMTFKELLAAGPLEGVDLERIRKLGRDPEL
jgi:hypothetical protein